VDGTERLIVDGTERLRTTISYLNGTETPSFEHPLLRFDRLYDSTLPTKARYLALECCSLVLSESPFWRQCIEFPAAFSGARHHLHANRRFDGFLFAVCISSSR